MIIVLCITAFLASMLTFFSGFGLGTILLPVFAIFFPLPIAISLTAIVHFVNNIFKVGLVGKYARQDILLKFGVPALIFSFLGALLMMFATGFTYLAKYSIGEYDFEITAIKLVIAIIIIAFTWIELIPSAKAIQIPSKYLPVGGALSGFFGGLSGHQGALRSMFLASLNLSKETFIGSGVVIALMIDVARLTIYSGNLLETQIHEHWQILLAATASACIGTWIGNRYLKKITMHGLQKIVAISLIMFSIALGAGLI